MSRSYFISLSDLISGLTTESVPQVTVSAITMDSRQVEAGGLFLSLAKDNIKRHDYLQQALLAKPAAVLYASEYPLTVEDKAIIEYARVPAVAINDLDNQAGEIAARFYGHPSQTMTVIAVTGTNGKTSVSHFIAQALEGLEYPCGVIGTLGTGRLNQLKFTGMTTPDPVTLQALLAELKQQGCLFVAMEASSHALQQGRLNSIDIDVAVFTNLTRDHLDYHQTMQSYAAAKRRLFDFKSLESAVINSSDNYGRELVAELQNTTMHVLAYSRDRAVSADLFAENLQLSQSGIRFTAHYQQHNRELELSLLGRFNVDNILATLAVLLVCDVDIERAVQAVSQCQPVAGRMQIADHFARPQIVIDYAHTPDALEQALKTLALHLSERGDLWCVFGCGGDRDKGKRPLMGQIAENYANHVVVTDDNPRTEQSSSIINDVLAGCTKPGNIYIEPDRKLAITHAINNAAEDDIVLVAGKGHEDYQEINNIKYPFRDMDVITEILAVKEQTISNNERAH